MALYRIWRKEVGRIEEEVHIYVDQAKPKFSKTFFVTEREIHANNVSSELFINEKELMLTSIFEYDVKIERVKERPKFKNVLDAAQGAFEFFTDNLAVIHHNMCIVTINKINKKVTISVWEQANIEKLYPKASTEKDNEITSIRND